MSLACFATTLGLVVFGACIVFAVICAVIWDMERLDEKEWDREARSP